MKKTIVEKLFARKEAKKENKSLFISVTGWGKEDAPLKDGLKLLPIKVVAPRA